LILEGNAKALLSERARPRSPLFGRHSLEHSHEALLPERARPRSPLSDATRFNTVTLPSEELPRKIHGCCV